MPWCTVEEAQVLAPPAMTVTEDNVELAQILVELFAGTTEEATDAENVSSRNLRLLENATRFQAVFCAAHPELTTLSDLESFSQGGVNVTLQTANSHLLAPLARRCVSRLSWKQRGVRARVPGAALDEYSPGNRDSVARDEHRIWDPLP
jgi:hypothetical protein